jgi:hypothetical protein
VKKLAFLLLLAVSGPALADLYINASGLRPSAPHWLPRSGCELIDLKDVHRTSAVRCGNGHADILYFTLFGEQYAHCLVAFDSHGRRHDVYVTTDMHFYWEKRCTVRWINDNTVEVRPASKPYEVVAPHMRAPAR